jgi:hypothetical protein
MRSQNGIPAAHDYAGTVQPNTKHTEYDHDRVAKPDRSQPKVLVELVVVEGPEGQQLHTMQAEVVRRVLTRLAERHAQICQEASRL